MATKDPSTQGLETQGHFLLAHCVCPRSMCLGSLWSSLLGLEDAWAGLLPAAEGKSPRGVTLGTPSPKGAESGGPKVTTCLEDGTEVSGT